MIKTSGLNDCSYKETSVALGCFDGLHLGHKKVITQAVELSGENLCPTVFTFSNIPEVKLKGKHPSNLLTIEDKLEILDTWGVRQVYQVKFSDIMDFSPEEFIAKILKENLKAKKVFCGFNYRFGKDGKGDTRLLIKLCKANGIEPYIVNPVRVDNINVSSTVIREYIKNGNVKKAKNMLGRYFSLNFVIVEGKRLGRKIGTPTLNQWIPEDFIMPKFGVYASTTHIGENIYCSVTNIGTNPTTKDGFPKAETWVPEYIGKDLYGKKIKVDLIEYLREEKKFSNLNELKSAVINDAEISENITKKKNVSYK